ncbi:YjzD family protein [Metabacillus sp. GX 13764]|uniref:YjzD family protein n=1 Tax=Metabacillus kandeliae TaxID=2900151 RepID=UPI001E3A3C05|nr:YjzD family protein [Metabacillus kandeliae]MCD7034956.1 YjzD family protein [Metabacillus kandeliae]
MRFIWTFIWAFLLVHMASYVATAMIGTSYNFGTASILGVIATVLLYIIASVVPDRTAETNHH